MEFGVDSAGTHAKAGTILGQSSEEMHKLKLAVEHAV